MPEIPLPDGCATYEPVVLKEILKSRCLLPEIEQEYHQLSRSFWRDANGWKDTAWHRIIKNQFQRALVDCSTTITQVICMGLGSFARHFALMDLSDATLSNLHGSLREHGRFTYHQFCALEFFLDLLRLHQNTFEAGKVYFQDPSFIDADEEFLRSKGFSIMRVPQAENMMTPTTFLYAPILPSNLLFGAFAVEYPALYLGNLRERDVEKEVFNHPDGATRAQAYQWDFDPAHYFIRNWSTIESAEMYLLEGTHQLIGLCCILKWRPRPDMAVTKKERRVTTWQVLQKHAKGMGEVEPYADEESEWDVEE